MPLCHKRCKVLLSPNKEFYDRMRLQEGKSYKELEKLALEKGEKIHYLQFFKHYSRHVSPAAELIREAIKRDDEWARKEVEEKLDLVKEIERNLQLCKMLAEHASKMKIDAKNITAITRLMSEIRLTLQFVMTLREKLTGKIEKSASEEELMSRVISALAILPEDQRTLVIRKLEHDSKVN